MFKLCVAVALGLFFRGNWEPVMDNRIDGSGLPVSLSKTRPVELGEVRATVTAIQKFFSLLSETRDVHQSRVCKVESIMN